MKRRIFEDSEIPNSQRQVAGVGANAVDPGATTLQKQLVHRNDDIALQNPNKMYPIEGIDQAISDAFINVSNAARLIETAKLNPTLKNHKNSFSKLEKNLKSITGILVDFDDTVAIIKNNEK